MSEATIEGFLPDAEATDILGRALATTQPARAVVSLHGDLGAGQSTLAPAWLRALGVEGPIRRPTYTLLERARTSVVYAKSVSARVDPGRPRIIKKTKHRNTN